MTKPEDLDYIPEEDREMVAELVTTGALNGEMAASHTTSNSWDDGDYPEIKEEIFSAIADRLLGKRKDA
ncbi:MAG: hypothetical protein ACE5G9_01880 [Nitrospinales bacterium]